MLHIIDESWKNVKMFQHKSQAQKSQICKHVATTLKKKSGKKIAVLWCPRYCTVRDGGYQGRDLGLCTQQKLSPFGRLQGWNEGWIELIALEVEELDVWMEGSCDACLLRQKKTYRVCFTRETSVTRPMLRCWVQNRQQCLRKQTTTTTMTAINAYVA